MTNVKIRIEVNPNAESESLGDIQNQVDGIPSSENVSNVSVKITGDGLFQEIPNKRGGINGLSLANNLVFDENGLLDNSNLQGAVLESTESPVEFIWGVVPSSGEYKVRLVFTDAKSLKDVIIYGDSVVNQFPTQATVNGKTVIYNDDLEWAINLGEESDTHIIEFTHWNKTNYNACISKIAVMLKYLELDKNNGLTEIESTSQSSSDTNGLYYGSIENFGSIEIVDKSGELIDMIRDGVIDNSNTNLEIMANDKVIQTHISTDSSYDNNTRVLSLDLGNRINSLDILKYKGYKYNGNSESLATILFDVLSNLKYVFGSQELTQESFIQMLSDKYDSKQTLYEYLQSCEIEYPFIEPNRSYRDVIDEFCLIGQMQMYLDDIGNIKFVSARPKVFDTEFNPIHIPKSNMFSQLNYNLILKNKYDGVEATKTDVSVKNDYNTALFTSEKFTYKDGDFEGGIPPIEQLNFSGKIVNNNYVFIRNIYYTASISIPIKTNSGLDETTQILNSLTTIDENGNVIPRYKLIAKKIKSDNYNPPYFKFSDNQEIIEFSSDWGYVEPPESIDRIKATYYIDGYGEVESKHGDNYSEKITINKFDQVNKYIVDIEILVAQKLIVTKNVTGVTPGIIEESVPESLEFSIFGTTRSISFDEIQSNTEGIDLAKTKVSLGSSNLLQKDEMVNAIKNNILNDYKKGVSSANVTISCNNYFGADGEKLINWSEGEVPRLNQCVYFDNDLYADKSQRYWKIKGRTFRKGGVPMMDLELEEVKKMELGDYSWNQIGAISRSGSASSMFSLGDSKQIVLSDGRSITATIIGFNHDKRDDGSTAGITFMVSDLNETCEMSTEAEKAWSRSKIRNEFLPSVYNLMPDDVKNSISTTKKTSEYNYATNGIEETSDNLWILSPSEITGNEKYNYLFDNMQNLIPNELSPKPGIYYIFTWWLRGKYSKTEVIITTSGNYYKDDNNPNSAIAIDSTATSKRYIIFGFCI